tara:strand:- start:739 stop:1266 length:528 start_codon:yes stop_codon:yes gene_type:complete
MICIKYSYKKSHISEKEKYGGPSAKEQIQSISENKNWIILNSSLLKSSAYDKKLNHRVNALKHALQTFGPASTRLPDLRNNEGKAKNYIYHGHVNDSNGVTYILEWAIIDAKQRVMTLIGFDTHENYKFEQNPLNSEKIEKILNDDESEQIFSRTKNKVLEVKNKIKRMNNYKNF